MADEVSVEQEQALAVARARRARAEAESTASWSDVTKQALWKAGSGLVDQTLNLPSNLKNLGKAAAELGDAAFGPGNVNVYGGEIPSNTGEFEIPNNTANDYLRKEGAITDLNMTPEQKIGDAAIQGGVMSVISPAQGARQMLTNTALGGVSGATGAAVEEATGSPIAGIAASIAVPGAAMKAPGATARAEQEALRRQVRDNTLKKANELGYVTIPDNMIASLANRPKLVDAAAKVNQDITNDIARKSLGVDLSFPLEGKSFDKYRAEQYNVGYKPLKGMGQFRPDNQYFVEVTDAEDKLLAGYKSFPDADRPQQKKIKDATDGHLNISNITSEGVVERIKTLRNDSSINIDSGDADIVTMGRYQKDLAEILENMLERQATKAGWPQDVMGAYKQARKNIAISHTVEHAVVKGTGNVDLTRLANRWQAGDYMSGELEIAANFGNAIKGRTAIVPNSSKAKKDDSPYSYAHLAGLAMGYKAATAMGLDPGWGALTALAGAKGLHTLNEATIAPALRARIMSKGGQEAQREDYSSLGLSPYMLTPGALANLPEGQ